MFFPIFASHSMSYLRPPRLIFAGQFQADPSTVNNDPQHFDSATFRSDYHLQATGATDGWWNPRGTGAWRFVGCTVQRVVYQDGTSSSDPNVDPIVGKPVNPASSRVEGKLVDLDPEQQMVSQIWGMRVLLGSSGQPIQFGGDFEPSAFADLWPRYPQGQPDSFFGAFFQGVLDVAEWQPGSGSRFLNEVAAGGGAPKQLSLKFLVDGYDDDFTSPNFNLGRVVGAIGMYSVGEPHHFVAGRCLLPLPTVPMVPPVPLLPVNTAYAEIDGDLLSIDLGNSLPTQSPGGPLADLQQLCVALLPPSQDPVVLEVIDYASSTWYTATAGILTIRLTADQQRLAATTPLGIVQNGLQGVIPVLSEASNGLFIRADEYVFRLNPGDGASTTFFATTFGKRQGNQQITLGYDPSSMQGQATQGAVPGPQRVGVPESEFRFPLQINTGDDGTAVLPIETGDPGNPRVYIDGQVYGVTYAPGPTAPPQGSVQNGNQMLSALVWSGYDIPDRPTWLRDVQPILQQYANLYPVMKPIVDLGNYASVVSRRAILQNVFTSPMTDPNYMPVTRDLSASKRAMLCRWLEHPLYMDLSSPQDLKIALQTAIELEHSTIPPYLCALYSIKPGANTEVATLIRSVVMEEMLHMALACNLLISIGGTPRIGQPQFVPNYPGPLPGGLRGGLTVRLRKCSIEQIRDVFLSIEQPEEAIEPVGKSVRPGDPFDVSKFTIGWFYDEILRSLEALSREGKITFGNASRQVSSWHGPGTMYVINTLDDARTAVEEIRHQGEGCRPLHPGDGDRELAHYYKFAEIVAGRHLVFSGSGFTYTGASITFDPDEVYPMMDDPTLAKLPPGSRASNLSAQFAQTYQALLNGLARTFNGEPGYLKQAIGLMYSMSLSARELMQVPSGRNDGTTAGPSFQLPVPR
jgi:Ferritin-like